MAPRGSTTRTHRDRRRRAGSRDRSRPAACVRRLVVEPAGGLSRVAAGDLSPGCAAAPTGAYRASTRSGRDVTARAHGAETLGRRRSIAFVVGLTVLVAGLAGCGDGGRQDHEEALAACNTSVEQFTAKKTAYDDAHAALEALVASAAEARAALRLMTRLRQTWTLSWTSPALTAPPWSWPSADASKAPKDVTTAAASFARRPRPTRRRPSDLAKVTATETEIAATLEPRLPRRCSSTASRSGLRSSRAGTRSKTPRSCLRWRRLRSTASRSVSSRCCHGASTSTSCSRPSTRRATGRPTAARPTTRRKESPPPWTAARWMAPRMQRPAPRRSRRRPRPWLPSSRTGS